MKYDVGNVSAFTVLIIFGVVAVAVMMTVHDSIGYVIEEDDDDDDDDSGLVFSLISFGI